MKILIDADACPVKDITEELAREYLIELIMISNQNHRINSEYARVIVVDNYAQAADMAIVNLTRRRDIVVTQDYGLASMVLAKGGNVIDPMGRQFNEENIDGLLMQRYINQKARQAGVRINGPRKRNSLDNERFYSRLRQMILDITGELQN